MGNVARAYLAQSRNLMSMEPSSLEASKQLKHHSKIKILHALSELPATVHDLGTFSGDVFAVPMQVSGVGQVIHISFAGTFAECGSTGKFDTLRQFYRTFLVVAASQEAQAKSWPCQIINDQLFLVTKGKQLEPEEMRALNPTSNNAAGGMSQEMATTMMSALSAEDAQLVAQVVQAAQCSEEVAFQALQSAGGDGQQAVNLVLQQQQQQQQ